MYISILYIYIYIYACVTVVLILLGATLWLSSIICSLSSLVPWFTAGAMGGGGVWGLVKGTGKGVIGLVVRPTTGIFDLTSATLNSIQK